MNTTFDRKYAEKVASTLSTDDLTFLSNIAPNLAIEMTYFTGLSQSGPNKPRFVKAEWCPKLDAVYELELLNGKIASYYTQAWGAAYGNLEKKGIIARNGKHSITEAGKALFEAEKKYKDVDRFIEILNKFAPETDFENVQVESDDVIVDDLKERMVDAVTEAQRIDVEKLDLQATHMNLLKQIDDIEYKIGMIEINSKSAWDYVTEIAKEIANQ